MTCKVHSKQGECRWEKNGIPIGIYPGKYEWAGRPETGDCSIRIIDASLEFDDGQWECQVTPSSFNSNDALLSEKAELVVREKPNSIAIRNVGDEGEVITASAGDEVELECVVKGGNPPADLKW